MSAGNVLTSLQNAYINTAKATQKRPCLVHVATLEAGTVGLRSAGGKLNTFYSQTAAITHANSLFRANRTPHPSDGAATITHVNYAENFNGVVYASITYSNGDTKHHYLDDSTLTAWVSNTALTLGLFRRPTVANGLRYEVTTAGTTHGSVQPTWPLVVGDTVSDGTVTWTARSNVITDTNCPHSKLVKKLSQKIYASSGSNVAFSKAGDPRDWTSANDAGFIPSGIQAPGSDTVTALGDYGGDLVVFYADSLQVWTVNANPQSNALRKLSSNTGTIYAEAAQTLAGDLIFLSQQGFRSVSLGLTTDNLQENDVGSAIDSLRDEITATDTPVTIYYPRLGQLWCLNAKSGVTKTYVYSFSKAVKLSAWQTSQFTVLIEAAAVLNNQLYVRVADVVYRVDNSAYADETTDAPTPPMVEMETFYQDCKTPGILKMFWGFDGLMKGSCEIAFKWQHKLHDGHVVEGVTDWQEVTDDLRPGAIQPMEICAVAVAIKVRHNGDEDFRCSNLTLHYENLGPMA